MLERDSLEKMALLNSGSQMRPNFVIWTWLGQIIQSIIESLQQVT